MMDRIIREVESDCRDRPAVDVLPADARPGPAAAISQCLRTAAALLRVAAIVTYSSSGATALRVARERPAAIVLSITPDPGIARRLVLSWGVHSVHLARPVQPDRSDHRDHLGHPDHRTPAASQQPPVAEWSAESPASCAPEACPRPGSTA